MKTYASSQPAASLPLFLLLALVALALLVSFFLTQFNTLRIFGVLAFVMVLATGLLWPEAGLYLVVFAMLLSPEITVGTLAGAAALGRGITLRMEDFLLIAIGLGWLLRRAPEKSAGFFRKTPLNGPISAYILACVVATAWGIVNGHVRWATGSFFVLKYIEYVVIFFMVANYMDTPEQARWLLVCLFITCFVTCLHGLGQIPTGQRVTAPFQPEGGEPNTYGGYLILMGAVGAAIFEHIKQYRVRLALIVLLVLILINLVYTESRSSYLAVVPTLLTLTYFSRWKVFVLGGMVIALVLSPVILPDVAKKRLAYTFAQPAEEGQLRVGKLRIDTSTSSRLESWGLGLKDWWRSSLLGYGVTGHIFMDAQFPRLLAETGIIGMLAFLWLIASMFRFALHTWHTHEDEFTRALAAGFTAGLVGLIFHAIGANTFIIVRIMEPFWLLSGILFVLAGSHQEELDFARQSDDRWSS